MCGTRGARLCLPGKVGTNSRVVLWLLAVPADAWAVHGAGRGARDCCTTTSWWWTRGAAPGGLWRVCGQSRDAGRPARPGERECPLLSWEKAAASRHLSLQAGTACAPGGAWMTPRMLCAAQLYLSGMCTG